MKNIVKMIGFEPYEIEQINEAKKVYSTTFSGFVRIAVISKLKELNLDSSNISG